MNSMLLSSPAYGVWLGRPWGKTESMDYQIEARGKCFRMTRAGQPVWQAELEPGEGERRLYLSEDGCLVIETSGIDWGLVTIVSAEGTIKGRVAVTDCKSRPSWPPDDLPLVLFAGDAWPWNSGNTPAFFLKQYFWWLLPDGARFVFDVVRGQHVLQQEFQDDEKLMEQQERVWALSHLSGDDLRPALAVIIRDRCEDSRPQLENLLGRIQPSDLFKTQAAPFTELCACECLLKMGLWVLGAKLRDPLNLEASMSSPELFDLAGPPDFAATWESYDRKETGEFWDYYQGGRQIWRVFWEPGSVGERIRHLGMPQLRGHELERRAAGLVRGWSKGEFLLELHRSHPPRLVKPAEPSCFNIRTEEVAKIDIYGHHFGVFVSPSEKLTLTRTEDGFHRDYHLREPLPPIAFELVQALIVAINAPVLPEPLAEQHGLSPPALLALYDVCVMDDNPSILLRLHLKSGVVAVLTTTSYLAYLVPWILHLEDGRAVRTYNLEISQSLAGLLPDRFALRERLLSPREYLSQTRCRRDVESPPYVRRPNPVDPNDLDENGLTALMRHAGEKKCFDALVKAGASLDLLNQRGFTGLQMACMEGKAEVVKRWLRAGASLEVRSQSGQTALMLAYNQPEIVKLLVDSGANLDALDADGDNALDQAVYASNDQSLQILLATGMDSSRAHRHASRRLAQVEMEIERKMLFPSTLSPDEQERAREEFLELIKSLKMREYDWEESPNQRERARALEILELLRPHSV